MMLRTRIILALAPIVLLVVALGVAGLVLINRLGGRIDQILRENYDSVRYMQDLNEAVERIDSSFSFALAGREDQARQQFEEYIKLFESSMRKELSNITLPGELDLAQSLKQLGDAYEVGGKKFYQEDDRTRRFTFYYGGQAVPGLLAQFKEIKRHARAILQLNQNNMEEASADAKASVTNALWWLGGGVIGALLLALVAGTYVIRTIHEPLQAMTESVLAIGSGDLDQVLVADTKDELGQLAGAFNTMARQLRHYRQSQRAEFQRTLQASQAAIDAFPHPVIILDAQGDVAMANPAAGKFFGVATPTAGVARAGWQAPESLREPLREAMTRQQKYIPEGFDNLIVLRDTAQERSFIPRILPIADLSGEPLGAAVLMEEVTKYRTMDELKSNLVATASHELKTPLSTIRLVVHLLLDESVGSLTPKQTELLLDARENTERLLQMIERLLDMAKLEGGDHRLDLQLYRPCDLLKAVADNVRPRAEGRNIDLVTHLPTGIVAVAVDEPRLMLALNNLVDNALRHTPDGGRITLDANADGDAVVFSVADNGPGIPAEHLPHLFERFYRVPGQRGGGTGLGLALVREIAVAHGGSVTCESGAGRGATFRLRIPIVNHKASASGQSHPRNEEPGNGADHHER